MLKDALSKPAPKMTSKKSKKGKDEKLETQEEDIKIETEMDDIEKKLKKTTKSKKKAKKEASTRQHSSLFQRLRGESPLADNRKVVFTVPGGVARKGQPPKSGKKVSNPARTSYTPALLEAQISVDLAF